jgi:aerobic-type carbon monoxide dehydrogenase small subunit (CoxS/CutS family)
MASYSLNINGTEYTVEASSDTPLLWILRDSLDLTGTKYSCGIGLCGTCTVLVDGEPTRSCYTPVSSINGQAIITIEGLSSEGTHPLQKAWIEEKVSQCGYCQPGQLMAAAALLNRNPNPSDEDITAAMAGNLCRCGTYNRIRRAIHRAAKEGG